MITIKYKHVLAFLLASLPLAGFAQATTEKQTFPLEPTFVLIAVAGSLIIMVALILFLAKNMTILLKAAIDKAKEWPKAPLIVLLMLAASLLPSILHAEEVSTTAAVPETDWFNTSHIILYLFIGVYTTLLIIIIWLANYFLKMVKQVYGKPEEKKEETVKVSALDKVLDSFNSSVPLEKEKDVMLDHNYDGIRELDNSLPPWWKYGFYFTIVFAFIYMYRFHVSGTGKLSIEEYQEEMSIAAAEKQEMLKNNDQKVDENTVVQLTDEASLADAKSVFTNVCSACHGMKGEGGAGPNLTDAYWLHGGDVKSIFKTITYGVPAKGMVAWGQTYKSSDIEKLASYVMSLQGSNPANAKAPQGDLFVKPSVPTDSTRVAADTTKKVAGI